MHGSETAGDTLTQLTTILFFVNIAYKQGQLNWPTLMVICW